MIQAGASVIVEACHDVVDGWELPTDAAELVWNAMAVAWVESECQAEVNRLAGYTPDSASALGSLAVSPSEPGASSSGSSGGSGGGPDSP